MPEKNRTARVSCYILTFLLLFFALNACIAPNSASPPVIATSSSAVTPPLLAPADSELVYGAKIPVLMDELQNSLGSLADIIFKYPEITSNSSLLADFQSRCSRLEDISAGIRALSPPQRYASSCSILKDAANYFSQAVAELRASVLSGEFERLQTVSDLLRKGNQSLDEGTKLFEQEQATLTG